MGTSEFAKEKIRFFLNPRFAFRNLQLYSSGQQWILLALAVLILGFLFFRFYVHPALPPPKIETEFVIEVTGEVWKPGIYIFQAPPALREAIEKAGGIKEGVHFKGRAFSEPLETGTWVSVAKESRIRLGSMAANKLLVFSIPFDLNRVSVEDLCLVPGIGDSLAREIVAHREKRKGFRSVSELKNVRGIGETKYRSFERFFTLRR
jgi:competence protein ComEA